MKRIMVIGLAVYILASGITIFAEQAQQAPSGHDQAVAELMKLMGIDRTMQISMEGMADSMIKNNPGMAPFRDVILSWTGKYLSWDAVAPEVTKAYKEALTEPEIREIIAFYKTPTGQKVLEKTPELLQKSMAIGSSIAQAHLEDLQNMIEARAKELETKKKP